MPVLFRPSIKYMLCVKKINKQSINGTSLHLGNKKKIEEKSGEVISMRDLHNACTYSGFKLNKWRGLSFSYHYIQELLNDDQ